MERLSNELRICDELRINYEGHFRNDKVFALTITSRKLYRTLEEFRTNLYKFLSNIGYKYGIIGAMEFHEKSAKVHCHCISNFGNTPKDNKNNDFYFKIDKIANLTGWLNYINKSSLNTLEMNSEVRAGIFDLHKKKVCLFDTSSDED